MKKLLLSLTLITFFTSFSQDYIPMLQEGNEWSVVYFAQFSTFTQVVKADNIVLVNGVSYRSVKVGEDVSDCLVREENGIVYYLIDESSNEEIVWYDFNLEVGDAFPVYYNSYCVKSFASDFGTAYVINVFYEEIAGQERKIIEFSGSPDGNVAEETWIEGIGSLSGFEPFGFGFDNLILLACYSFEEIQIMFNGYDECSFFILSADENKLNQIKITPNPVSELATLTIPQEIQSASITVYDLNGKQLMKQDILEENASINFSSLSSGMYFYSIYSENELILTKKLLVK